MLHNCVLLVIVEHAVREELWAWRVLRKVIIVDLLK